MGLAASQARFLAITARKMNCEFQSMQIAQEKLSVTRDLQKASTKYQQALDATKLVWDCGTVDNDIYDLSYKVLMSPSAINEYDPYLITDTKGKVVLSEAMWQAAIKAGIIDEKGDPISSNKFTMGNADSTNDGSRNAFLYQLGVKNVAATSTINSIIELGEEGYTKSGIGGEVIDKTLASNLNGAAFINYLSTEKGENGEYLFGIKFTDEAFGVKEYNVDGDGNSTGEQKVVDGKPVYQSQFSEKTKVNLKDADDKKLFITEGGKNGSILSQSDRESLTLGDILDGKYSLALYCKDGNGNCDGLMSQVSGNILDYMARLLGYGSTSQDARGLGVTDEAREALSAAYEMTKAMFCTKPAEVNTKESKADKSFYNALEKAQEQNRTVKAGKSGKGNVYSVSLSNMLKAFLTNFALVMDGFDSGLNVDKESVKKSNYVTDHLDYYFQISNTTMPAHEMLNADFYNMLYNQICQNGACNDATKREKVMDEDYLAHALKNGQLFISSLNTDGYFYQGPYTASGHVSEVKDDDAIARAEAEYNVTKSKLNYKEETLELQMKNLDTEISALSTEFETVKGLIGKNVEKIFTMFSS